MLEPSALHLELIILVFAQIGRLDLGQLVAQHLLQARSLALFGDEFAERLACHAQLADQPGDFGALGQHGGVPI